MADWKKSDNDAHKLFAAVAGSDFFPLS